MRFRIDHAGSEGTSPVWVEAPTQWDVERWSALKCWKHARVARWDGKIRAQVVCRQCDHKFPHTADFSTSDCDEASCPICGRRWGLRIDIQVISDPPERVPGPSTQSRTNAMSQQRETVVEQPTRPRATTQPRVPSRAEINAALDALPSLAQQAVNNFADCFIELEGRTLSDEEIEKLILLCSAKAVHKAGMSARTTQGLRASKDLYEGYGQDILELGLGLALWRLHTADRVKGGAKKVLKYGAIAGLAAFGIWGG